MKIPTLSEDWLATIIGLAIVAVVALGLLGPGPQNVTVRAEPGEFASAIVGDSFFRQVTICIGDTTTEINTQVGFLNDVGYAFWCRGRGIQVIKQMDVRGIPELQDNDIIITPQFGRLSFWIQNDCDQPASITYRTDAAIRWPLFNVFGR
ncbi:MAG: hypothetical protein SF123_21420 [Chloroflexota bacterium]|nr:hypothetical protein [Chloroflexota bacterium]